MIGYFTIYGAVLRDESIAKEFLTGISLTIGTAIGASCLERRWAGSSAYIPT
jgi:hypothetical protein